MRRFRTAFTKMFRKSTGKHRAKRMIVRYNWWSLGTPRISERPWTEERLVPKVVPLVVYYKGERHVIGEGKLKKDGSFTAILNGDPLVDDLFKIPADFSVSYLAPEVRAEITAKSNRKEVKNMNDMSPGETPLEISGNVPDAVGPESVLEHVKNLLTEMGHSATVAENIVLHLAEAGVSFNLPEWNEPVTPERVTNDHPTE